MEVFKADTDVMRASANKLAEAGNQLSELSSSLSALPGKVDSKAYQGQLASKVQNILSGASAQAGALQNESNSLSNELGNKASEIDQVNQASGASVNHISSSFLTENGPLYTLFHKYGLLALEAASTLLATVGLAGTIQKWITAINSSSNQTSKNGSSNKITEPPPPPQKAYFLNAPTTLLENKEKGKNIYLPAGTRIDEVRATDDESRKIIRVGSEEYLISVAALSTVLSTAILTSSSASRGEGVDPGLSEKERRGNNPYVRYVNGVPSNCTWYAASAVYSRSEGRIDLPNVDGSNNWREYPAPVNKEGIQTAKGWGGGGEWTSYAENLVKQYDDQKAPLSERAVLAVDRSPQAGDVYSNESVHVAYVEETWLSEDSKKIYVVVSEENAGSYVKETDSYKGTGNPVGKPSEQITVENGESVKRFRRVITFDNAAKEGETPSIPEKKGRFIHFNYDGYGK